MARIRTIKPEFWVDEKVVELSFPARLLFIGLWNFSDDDGRMVYSPRKIQMQIFPADVLDISALFGEIRGNSLISIYEHDSVEYLQINNFSKHQKIDKRSPSKLPAPPNSPESQLRKGSRNGSRKGREGKTHTVADAPLGEFETFWKTYPKRIGQNPKKPAITSFASAVKRGVSPQTIIDGAARYAAASADLERQYIAQAVTWLRQERWNDETKPANRDHMGAR